MEKVILSNRVITKTRTVNRTANKVSLLTSIWKKLEHLLLGKIQFPWNEMKSKNASRYSNMQCNAKKLIAIRSHVQSKYFCIPRASRTVTSLKIRVEFVREALIINIYNGWVHDVSMVIFGPVDHINGPWTITNLSILRLRVFIPLNSNFLGIKSKSHICARGKLYSPEFGRHSIRLLNSDLWTGLFQN